jgi:predicted permease
VAEPVQGLYASGSFFELLGVRALAGRTFTLDDDRRGGGSAGAVAVISHGFWQRRYDGAADAVGRTLRLNGVPFTVIGVTPPSFFGPTVGRSFDVAVPIGLVDRLQQGGAGWLDGRSTWWLEILGRLGPGQGTEAATRALRAVQPQVREATIPWNWPAAQREAYLRDSPFTLVPASSGVSELRGAYARSLVAMLGVVALVLLIACANLASLQLARGHARRPELAARLALGASRGRLLRQLLAESLLLALPGGLAGLALARVGTRLLLAQITLPGDNASLPAQLDVSLHAGVLLFTLAVTVATALLFGVAPGLSALRLAPYDAMRPQGRVLGSASSGTHGSRLVVAQVALSVVLVFAAGLFLRTFSGLVGRDMGLVREGLLAVSIDAQRSAAAADRRALYARVQEEVAALPGVTAAAVSLVAPVSGAGWNDGLRVQGEPEVAGEGRYAWMNAVTPGWFATYGTQLVAGRDFDERDRVGSPPVAIVNEAFARRFARGGIPIGRIALREGPPGAAARAVEIVGLVRDSVYRSPRDTMEPIVFLPLSQLPAEEAWPVATLGVRATAGEPAALSRAVSAAVTRVDPQLSLAFRPFAEQVGDALRRERVVAALSAFFGALALLLAAIGLYGVTAYSVGRRRAEIALRLALGARAGGVLRMVLGRVLRLVALGLVIGAAAALWAARFVSSLLYGLPARDLPTLLAVTALLLAVCAFAAALPARGALRIDPARVLREG